MSMKNANNLNNYSFLKINRYKSVQTNNCNQIFYIIIFIMGEFCIINKTKKVDFNQS